MRRVSSRLIATLAAAAAAVSVPVVALGGSAAADPAPALLGVYSGSAASGVSGHNTFQSWTGTSVPYALDFAAAANGWKDMESPNWLFDAWNKTSYRLVYSLQMFPKDVQNSIGGPAALQQCANGSYNSHWRTLGLDLVAEGLPDTIVRPGWEMNGDWFGWAAKGRTDTYIGCFRQIVTSMRAASGQRFVFNWNPGIGGGTFPAEQAYPGDAYVDQIGLDLYDWTWAPGVYDTKDSQTAAQRQAAVESAWQAKLTGDHGLRFWSSFAQTHGLPLSFPEWALADRTADEYGGGDNPYFIQKMFEFIYDPANNVAFASYFNSASPDGEHRLLGSNAFPKAAALFQQLAQNPPVPTVTVVECVVIPTPDPAPATAYPIWTSSNGAYANNPVKLDGRTLTNWALYAWINANTNIKHVQYFVDNPTATGTPKRDEWTAPYDLGGSTTIGSAAVDTTDWTIGVHTVTAKVFLKDGTTTLSQASVIKPQTEACSQPTTTTTTTALLTSTSGTRTGATTLNGSIVTTSLHAWAVPTGAVTKVEFRIDDANAKSKALAVETSAPYDLGGTSGKLSGGYSTGKLATGKHVLTARVFRSDGSVRSTSASFTVRR